jgi:hypothetical protein
MKEKLDYETFRNKLIYNLEQAIKEQKDGRFESIDKGFDDFDEHLPRGQKGLENIFIGLNFWDGWIDARNHDWNYYKGIEKNDWPRLAKIIVDDLKCNREINETIILKHFDFRKKSS